MAAYSFLDTSATIVGPGGIINIGIGSGAADEGVQTEPAERNEMKTGADGAVMHVLQAQRTGKLMIHLLKTSPVNQQLSIMQETQMASAALHGQNVITLTQTGLGDVVTATQVAFRRGPPLGYGKDGPNVTWELDCGILHELLGGGG